MKKKFLCFVAAVVMLISSVSVYAAAPAVFITSGSIGAPVSISSTTIDQVMYTANDKTFTDMVKELRKDTGWYYLDGTVNAQQVYAAMSKIDGSVFWTEVTPEEARVASSSDAINDPANYDRIITLAKIPNPYGYGYPYVNGEGYETIVPSNTVDIASGNYQPCAVVPAYMKPGYFYSAKDAITANDKLVSNPTELGHVYKWNASVTYNGITTRSAADTANLFYMFYGKMNEVKTSAEDAISTKQAPAILDFLNANTSLGLADIKVKSINCFEIYGNIYGKASVVNFTTDEINKIKSGNSIIVMHYNTSDKKWEHIADATLSVAFDGTKYVSGTFTSFSPVVVFEVESMSNTQPTVAPVETPVKVDENKAPSTGSKFLGL